MWGHHMSWDYTRYLTQKKYGMLNWKTHLQVLLKAKINNLSISVFCLWYCILGDKFSPLDSYLSLSSSSRTMWVTNVLYHFYHIFYHVWLISTSSITLSRYALITMPEILHVCSHSTYLNVTKTTWRKECKPLFLGFSALICLLIVGRDLSTFWLPFSHLFFFPAKSASYPKLEKSWLLKKRLLSHLISEGHSYWLDSLDKLSRRGRKCKDMEDKTAIAKSKGNTPFLSSFSINIVHFFFFWQMFVH